MRRFVLLTIGLVLALVYAATSNGRPNGLFFVAAFMLLLGLMYAIAHGPNPPHPPVDRCTHPAVVRDRCGDYCLRCGAHARVLEGGNVLRYTLYDQETEAERHVDKV